MFKTKKNEMNEKIIKKRFFDCIMRTNNNQQNKNNVDQKNMRKKMKLFDAF